MSDAPDSVLTNVDGVVKWFDPRKGFGFIVGPDEQDIFIHYSQIIGDGFRVLSDGCAVQYDAEKGNKGWHATRVIRTDAEVQTRPVRPRSPRRATTPATESAAESATESAAESAES